MEHESAPSSRWVDRLGICASIGCGLHCAAFTVVILMVPTLWLHRGLRSSGLWEALWWLEIGLLVFAWLFALLASWHAWRRYRSRWVPALAMAGLALLTLTIASPFHGRSPWISALALAGGLLVALAHGLNLRRARRLSPRSA